MFIFISNDLFHLIVTNARERNQVSSSDIRGNWDTESLSDSLKVSQLLNDRTKLGTGSFEHNFYNNYSHLLRFATF